MWFTHTGSLWTVTSYSDLIHCARCDWDLSGQFRWCTVARTISEIATDGWGRNVGSTIWQRGRGTNHDLMCPFRPLGVGWQYWVLNQRTTIPSPQLYSQQWHKGYCGHWTSCVCVFGWIVNWHCELDWNPHKTVTICLLRDRELFIIIK